LQWLAEVEKESGNNSSRLLFPPLFSAFVHQRTLMYGLRRKFFKNGLS
jgi:hypothetical protein